MVSVQNRRENEGESILRVQSHSMRLMLNALGKVALFLILVLSGPPVAFANPAPQSNETDEARAIRLFNESKYDDAIALAKVIDAELGKFSIEEKWQLMIIEGHLKRGRYGEALTALNAALEEHENSIRLRLLGVDVLRFNDEAEKATDMFNQIGELAGRQSWRYRDRDNLILLGTYFRQRGADAKDILDTFFYPLRKQRPSEPEVHRAIGQLALDKHDYGLAAESFLKVVELLPNDSGAHYLLAAALRKSDSEKSNVALKKALEIAPGHADALIMLADQNVSAENYVGARELLDEVFAVNPHHPEGWAYRAVLAHLNNQPNEEGQCRDKALANWPGNPVVDYTIGRELSEKYRFKEGAAYQRRSLIYDEAYLPAKIQLAHDLLRLGQELEGWKIAEEVFDADQYSVVAHNLVTLRENMSKFRTLQRDGFVVRMSSEEADIYGERVLDLLVRARDVLCKKYDVELDLPVFIEIFPKQQDFAIRTFGLPGGAGFLGVCFGRVITMNSPAAQGANLTSWESVLWHEFCHVVTLQKTKNKMPRWLSEGISVYEEEQANSAWGDEMSIEYRKMVLGDELTPVSKLSGAFLRPPSPVHLQFAYYESSLVVEYIVAEYGLKSLVDVLNELSIGTPINDALRRHVAPVEFLDRKFAEFARKRANDFAAGANWDELDKKPEPTVQYWVKWNKEHPDNLVGLLQQANLLMKEERWAEAIASLKRVNELSPEIRDAYSMLAKCYRETEQPDKAFEILVAFAKVEASNVELFIELIQESSSKKDWKAVLKYSDQLSAVNPLLTTPHHFMAKAAEELNDDSLLIRSLQVLAKMNPLDAADVHYRLANALKRENRMPEAKLQVLKALEQAPRYRDAHRLLLEIAEGKQQAAEEPVATPKAGSEKEVVPDSSKSSKGD